MCILNNSLFEEILIEIFSVLCINFTFKLVISKDVSRVNVEFRRSVSRMILVILVLMIVIL